MIPKRQPKPIKTAMIETFIKVGIPFLNCPAGEVVVEGIEVLDAILSEAHKHGPFEPWKHDNAQALRWRTNPSALEVFKDAQGLAAWMVNRAVNPGEGDEDGDNFDIAREAVGALGTFHSIRDPRGRWIPMVQWSLPWVEGETLTERMIGRRGALSLILAFTLETFRGISTGRGVVCPAAAWIGVCPRCGTAFEKRRGDQEFCSRACLDVIAKRRQRK